MPMQEEKEHPGEHCMMSHEEGATETKQTTFVLAVPTSTSVPVLKAITLEAILVPEVGKCQQESITYTISCVGCAAGGVTTQYYSESGCTGYQCTLEHSNAHGDRNKNSPLWRHIKSFFKGIM